MDDHGFYKGLYDPHIFKEKTMKGVFDALVILYNIEYINKKMTLHRKLIYVEMTRSNTITCYLMTVTQIHYHLVVVGEKVENKELVYRALKGFSP